MIIFRHVLKAESLTEKGSMLETVELNANLGSVDVGKLLKASGTNSAGQLKVKVAGNGVASPFVAIKESVGSSGDLVQVLLRGDVKIKTSDGAIAVGGGIWTKGR